MTRPNHGDLLSDVAVVVVTFNSEDYISRCAQSLTLRRLWAFVIVDNASTDRTEAVVRELDSTDITFHSSAVNRGFGVGCNVGALLSLGARWTLFLNPDASIDDDSLTTLCEYMQSHPDCAVVSPLLRREGSPISPAGAVATFLTEIRWALPRRVVRLVPDRRFPADYAASGPVGAVEGACMLVDSHAFRSVGMFDPHYFLFFEEHDLARRLRAAGRTTDICADSVAEHAVGAARRSLEHAARPELIASTVKYLRRWHGVPVAVGYTLLAMVSVLTRAGVKAVTPKTAQMWLYGLREGFRRRRYDLPFDPASGEPYSWRSATRLRRADSSR